MRHDIPVEDSFGRMIGKLDMLLMERRALIKRVMELESTLPRDDQSWIYVRLLAKESEALSAELDAKYQNEPTEAK
jgi:hypothetical protein